MWVPTMYVQPGVAALNAVLLVPSDQQLLALLDASTPPLRVAIAALAGTGFRISDVCAIASGTQSRLSLAAQQATYRRVVGSDVGGVEDRQVLAGRGADPSTPALGPSPGAEGVFRDDIGGNLPGRSSSRAQCLLQPLVRDRKIL